MLAVAGTAVLAASGSAAPREMRYACALKSNGSLRYVAKLRACRRAKERRVDFHAAVVKTCMSRVSIRRITRGRCRQGERRATLPAAKPTHLCAARRTRKLRRVKRAKCRRGELLLVLRAPAPGPGPGPAPGPPPDQPPTAVNDSASLAEDAGATVVAVLDNDTDADGGAKQVMSVSQPAHGTTANGSTNVSYSPAADYCGADSFSYTLNGGSTATVSLTVSCINDPAVAADDSASFVENESEVPLDVRSNDSDVEGDQIPPVASTSDPPNGTAAVFNAGDMVSYAPDHGFCGPDSFTYTLEGAGTATVNVNVECTNDAPRADDETFNGSNSAIGNTTLIVNDPSDGQPPYEGHAAKVVEGDILAGDTDQDGDPLTVNVPPSGRITSNDGATVEISADGDFAYYPNAGTSCTDNSDFFDYEVLDGRGEGDFGRVTVGIQDCVWYVKPGTTGDGTSRTPFGSLVDLDGSGGSGDVDASSNTIFLFDGVHTGGLPLESNQKLLTEKHGLPGVLDPSPGATPRLDGGLVLASNNTVQGLDLGQSGSASVFALSGSSVGTATVNTVTSGSLNNPSGGAVNISGGTVQIAFTSLSSSSSTTDGIRLDNAAGNFTASGGSIQSATEQAVDISGDGSSDTVNFTYDGTISDDNSLLVSISGQNGGTKDFNGAITDGPGFGGGVSLAGNTGATIRFDGGMSLSTTAQNGFSASNGGTLSVTDPAATDNTITTSTGTALNVSNVTIAADDLTFRSISSDGANTTVNLNNTGSLGSLDVTGSGSVNACSAANFSGCTGGSIVNSNRAFDLTSVGGGVNLTRMRIQDAFGDGIVGASVQGFTLTSSVVSSNGNVSGDSGLDFTGLTGTVQLLGNAIVGNRTHGVAVSNTSGTLSLSASGGGTFNSSQLGDGINLRSSGTATQTLNVQGPTFTDNNGDHIDAAASGTSTLTATVSAATLNTTNPVLSTGGGIVIGGAEASSVDTTLQGNTITAAVGNAIDVANAAASTGTVEATIQNNTTTSPAADGIRVYSGGTGTVTTRIQSNSVSNYNAAGINVRKSEGAGGALSASVFNNLLSDANATAGLLVRGGATAGDDGELCLNAGDPSNASLKNSLTSSSASAPSGFNIVVIQRLGVTFRMPQYAGPATEGAGVDNYLQNRNNAGGTPTVSSDSDTTTPDFANAPSGCVTP